MAIHHTSVLQGFLGAEVAAASQPDPEHEQCRRSDRHQSRHAGFGVAVVGPFDTGSFDTGSFNTGSFNTGSFNTGSFNTGTSRYLDESVENPFDRPGLRDSLRRAYCALCVRGS